MTEPPTPQATIPGVPGFARVGWIAGLAVLLALPALRGEFVGGDDHRLVLNHVLVNHPSFAHAIALFQIAHRDLYQPLPLLSFQCEFLVGGWLGLFDRGPNAGAWFFHANNLLLHALNAVLAAWLVLTIARLRHRGTAPTPQVRRAIIHAATIAGVLFSTHPFQVEVASWINGRMMLLSTVFALAASLAFVRYLETHRAKWCVLMLLCVLFCALSKVRAPLPLLLGVVVLAASLPLNRRFWKAWAPVCVIVATLVLVNLRTTADAALFAGGAQQLHGPRVVRVLLALAFYVEHLLLPLGLNSYYPTPTTVSWSDPATLRAITVVAASAVVVAAIAWRPGPCRLALAWGALAISDTLPFFPARNVLAADRYMYLPMVGVAWCVGELVGPRLAGLAQPSARRLLGAGGCAVVAAFVLTGWPLADAYTTSLKKTRRTATLFPDTPRVWQRVGWCYERTGDYDRAIEAAYRELAFDDEKVQSEALQLLGTALLHQGRTEQGIVALQRAVTKDPASAAAKQRLGRAFDEIGRFEEAIGYYEQAVAAAPGDNPTLRRLALLYRRFGRLADARRLYEQALSNNPYDPEAVIGLTELDIETANSDAYRSAEARLASLLSHLPDNRRLIANRDMIRFLLTQADENMETAASTFVALTDGRYALATQRLETIAGNDPSMLAARLWLREAMAQLSARRPDEPWTYALVTRILIADGEAELARRSLELLEQRCTTSRCTEYARALREML